MEELQTEFKTGQRLGNYILLREAGRGGGPSVIYEALDVRIGRRVALKVVTLPAPISPAQQEQYIRRFNREVRTSARLSHPNVVTIHDIGSQDGSYYFVMEFLEGQTLRERLEDGPLTPPQAASILDQIAEALDAVHAHEVVHGDVKPSNIMLLPDDRVKLMDFGIARQTGDALATQLGQMAGSPAYMAPEQIAGAPTTPASDIWGLGALLYQMLAGRPPFVSENIASLMYQVTQTSPPPIPLSAASYAVQEVIGRALEKDPTRRYASARQLATAFRNAIMRAPLPRPVEPLPRRTRLALLLTALALLGVLTGSTYYYAYSQTPHRIGMTGHKIIALLTLSPVTPRIKVAGSRQEFRPQEILSTVTFPKPSGSPSLLGVWHGTHTHYPATLVVTRGDGRTFFGIMTIHAPSGQARVVLKAQVEPGYHLCMRETRLLSSSTPHLWKLGTESGQLRTMGFMEGIDTDPARHFAQWSFTR